MSTKKPPRSRSKPPREPRKQRSLDELIGVEIFEDSAKRKWLLRARSIGEIQSFFNALEMILAAPADVQRQCNFLRRTIEPVEPTMWQSIRRFFGLTYFSKRYISKCFLARDFGGALEAVCKCNIDKDLKSFVEDIEAQKKTNGEPIPIGPDS